MSLLVKGMVALPAEGTANCLHLVAAAGAHTLAATSLSLSLSLPAACLVLSESHSLSHTFLHATSPTVRHSPLSVPSTVLFYFGFFGSLYLGTRWSYDSNSFA